MDEKLSNFIFFKNIHKQGVIFIEHPLCIENISCSGVRVIRRAGQMNIQGCFFLLSLSTYLLPTPFLPSTRTSSLSIHLSLVALLSMANDHDDAL